MSEICPECGCQVEGDHSEAACMAVRLNRERGQRAEIADLRGRLAAEKNEREMADGCLDMIRALLVNLGCLPRSKP